MPHKVALITGGASGMGLAVATVLSQQTTSTWTLHLIDLNASAGASAASSLPNAHFHETNVTDYTSLSTAFQNAFEQSGRIDFVYANAGIVERDNFYEDFTKREEGTGDDKGSKGEGITGPPPEPNQLSIDINFKAVVNTSYLALHYFRLTRERDEKEGRKGDGFGERGPVLVMTASCGGLYPSEFCPMYSGAKAAVIHFNRAIAFAFHREGFRTYATAPGTIKTNLLPAEGWEVFPRQFWTPMSSLVRAVQTIVDGGDMEDSKGKKVKEEDAWGLTVEVSGENMYFREGVEWSDDNMRDMMVFTGMRYQAERIEKEKRDKEAAQ